MVIKKSNDPMTIKGRVIAFEKDRHEKILELAIETDDFQEYVVAHDNQWEKLIKLVSKDVIVMGIVQGYNVHGYPIINIQIIETDTI